MTKEQIALWSAILDQSMKVSHNIEALNEQVLNMGDALEEIAADDASLSETYEKLKQHFKGAEQCLRRIQDRFMESAVQ